jgi:hypothetical protein
MQKLLLEEIFFQSPSSFASPLRMENLSHFYRKLNLPPSFICKPLQAFCRYPFTLLQSPTTPMDRQHRSIAINPSPKEVLGVLGQQAPASRVSPNEVGLFSQEKTCKICLQSALVKGLGVAADCNQRCNNYDSKGPIATKETPTFYRQETLSRPRNDTAA